MCQRFVSQEGLRPMRLLRELFFIVAVGLGLAAAFRTAAFATFFIPSESMVPTLEVGDRLAVSKFAYGWSRYSLPLTNLGLQFNGRILGSLPARGDVVVFVHPLDGRTMIKRVIGLPGDRIQLQRGRLYINSMLVPRHVEATYHYREQQGAVIAVTRYTEQLPGGHTHAIIQRSDNSPVETMPEAVVPAGHLFMMGDNRDNSADSRFPNLMGPVPVENLIGRADTILYSNYECQTEPGLYCAQRRSLTAIE
jgi:signal peptidase I